jgi:Uma2 family endonuclease
MFIASFIAQNGLEGYLTGEGGGYVIEEHVFAPDVAYTTQPVIRKGFAPHPPLLAVEVLSDPHNNREQSDIRRKLAVYLRAGVVVWVVDYEAEQVDVFVGTR